jgi:hypothetical protein
VRELMQAKLEVEKIYIELHLIGTDNTLGKSINPVERILSA